MPTVEIPRCGRGRFHPPAPPRSERDIVSLRTSLIQLRHGRGTHEACDPTVRAAVPIGGQPPPMRFWDVRDQRDLSDRSNGEKDAGHR